MAVRSLCTCSVMCSLQFISLAVAGLLGGLILDAVLVTLLPVACHLWVRFLQGTVGSRLRVGW